MSGSWTNLVKPGLRAFWRSDRDGGNALWVFGDKLDGFYRDCGETGAIAVAHFGSRASEVEGGLPRALPVTVGQRRAAGAAFRIRSDLGGRLPGDGRDRANSFNMSKSESARARKGRAGQRGQVWPGQPAVGFSMGSDVSYSYGRNLAGILQEFRSCNPGVTQRMSHPACWNDGNRTGIRRGGGRFLQEATPRLRIYKQLKHRA